MRQALAGMLWSKQFYHYDVTRWFTVILQVRRLPKERETDGTVNGHICYNDDVISMPDKWEYPMVRSVGSRVPLHSACAC